MEWLAFFLIFSVGTNGWQFYDRGKLKTQRNQYRAIAEQCAKGRESERRTALVAADEKQAEQDAIRGELARQEQHVRGVIKDANDTCLDADSVLGSELYDREKQSTDHVNGIWVRGSSFTDDE